MKRWLLALLLAVLPSLASAATFNCLTEAACATTPCAFNAASTWTDASCNGAAGFPNTDGTNQFTATVSAGHTVIVTADAASVGNVAGSEPLTINGTLIHDEASTGRDAAGFRNFTIKTAANGQGVTIGGAGVWRAREGTRIKWDTASGFGAVTVNNGGTLDHQGEILETTISAITAQADSIALCASVGDPPGRAYTITPAAYATRIKGAAANSRRRLSVMSGKAMNQHYEIRVLNGSPVTTFNVCTDLPDSDSGTDTTGGQRLTPHVNRNAFCTGAGAPIACCSGLDAGTCPDRPTNVHSIPTRSGNTACTANEAPYGCCTGAGAGNCQEMLPAVGDEIAIVNDVVWMQSAGTNGYRIVATNASPMPILRGINFANIGARTGCVSCDGIEMGPASSSVAMPDFEFNNIHDTSAAIDIVRFRGGSNFKVRFNAFHDVIPETQGDTNAFLASTSTLSLAGPANNVSYENNVFYRSQGVQAHLNEGGTAHATGCTAVRNTSMEGCLNRNAECAWLQVDDCGSPVASDNLVFDLSTGEWGVGNVFGISINDAASSAHHNWIVNIGGTPGGGAAPTADHQLSTFTANYVSHTSAGADYGRYFGNVIKNVGLRQTNDVAFMDNPVRAYGNFVGLDVSVEDGADCTGSFFCSPWGIRLAKVANQNDNQAKVLMSDNIVTRLSGNGTFFFSGKCVFMDGAGLGGGGDDADFDADIDHTTCDGRGSTGQARAMGFWQTVTPSPSITVNFRDYVSLNTDGTDTHNDVNCTAQAGISEVFGVGYSRLTATATESGGGFGDADCSSTGTLTRVPSLLYRNSGSGDYNLLPGSPALTAGAAPAGSALGVRAFRFNYDYWDELWGGVLTFDGEQPANVSNGVSNADSDGDGVMDIHDNCDPVFNPSQADTDNDGVGDLCE